MKCSIKIFAACIFLSFGACNSTKSTTSNSSSITEESNKSAIYRLIVSFYSTASGIDQKAKQAFTEWIKKDYSSIAMEATPWGREGEVDICFSLKGMSSDEQSNFVNKAKENLSNAKNVHFYENEACKHNR